MALAGVSIIHDLKVLKLSNKQYIILYVYLKMNLLKQYNQIQTETYKNVDVTDQYLPSRQLHVHS